MLNETLLENLLDRPRLGAERETRESPHWRCRWAGGGDRGWWGVRQNASPTSLDSSLLWKKILSHWAGTTSPLGSRAPRRWSAVMGRGKGVFRREPQSPSYLLRRCKWMKAEGEAARERAAGFHRANCGWGEPYLGEGWKSFMPEIRYQWRSLPARRGMRNTCPRPNASKRQEHYKNLQGPGVRGLLQMEAEQEQQRTTSGLHPKHKPSTAW